jgi:hypothetical protein
MKMIGGFSEVVECRERKKGKFFIVPQLKTGNDNGVFIERR